VIFLSFCFKLAYAISGMQNSFSMVLDGRNLDEYEKNLETDGYSDRIQVDFCNIFLMID